MVLVLVEKERAEFREWVRGLDQVSAASFREIGPKPGAARV